MFFIGSVEGSVYDLCSFYAIAINAGVVVERCIKEVRERNMTFDKNSRFTRNRWTVLSPVTALVLVMSLMVSMPVSGQDQPVGLQVDSLAVGDEAPLWGMRRMGTTSFVFLRDFAGELRTEARLRGVSHKNVVLSFFASWCKPCPNEMAMLTRIAKEYEGRDVVFFFINFAETDQAAEAWLAKHPDIQGEVLMDSFLVTAKKYGAAILPRTIIIDKNRVVRFIEQGFVEEHYWADVTFAIDMVLVDDSTDSTPQPEIPPN